MADASSSLPRSVTVGTNTYYLDRASDFARRNPARQPTAYYLDFGDKCLHQFRAVQPEMSEHGHRWIDATLRSLQDAIEQARNADPAAFGQLELSDREFHDFVFSTHAAAYIESGIYDLPADDLWKILRTPDMTDLISPDAIQEILDLLAAGDRDDVDRIVARTAEQNGLMSRVATLMMWVRKRLRSMG